MPSFSPHIRNRSHLRSSKKQSESLPLAAEKKVTESYKIPVIHSPKSIPLCHLLSHFSPNTAVHSVTSDYQIFNLFFYKYVLQTFLSL